MVQDLLHVGCSDSSVSVPGTPLTVKNQLSLIYSLVVSLKLVELAIEMLDMQVGSISIWYHLETGINTHTTVYCGAVCTLMVKALYRR